MNLVDDRNWRFGPAGMWRIGRDDIEDDVKGELPDIDGALELGLFAAHEEVGTDPRNRWWIGGNFTHGKTGENNSCIASAFLRLWVPLGQYSAFSLS